MKKKASHSKADVRYWQAKVFQINRGGVLDHNFSVKIQFQGRRETLTLGTPNKAAAATHARDIYLTLRAEGWEPVLRKWKPSHVDRTPQDSPTVGQLFEAYRSLSNVRDSTFTAYVNAFRLITSRIAGIEFKPGEDKAWRAKVDRVKLDTLTPSAVQAWKSNAIKAAGTDPSKLRKAKKTVNSTVLNARSLFAAKYLRFLRERLALPDPLPFDEVTLEKRQSSRYQSKIDAPALIAAAQEELADRPQEQKILFLALMCGLRKAEIDGLEWDAFNFERGTLRLENTEHLQLKSEESAAEIDLDPELITRFMAWKAEGQGRFVIESPTTKRTPRSYRAAGHFNRLNRWLRSHGIDSQKPLHELRKECGALVNARAGIYAASRFLRHKDIAVTSQHYLDKKERITSGLGGLLEPGRQIESI